MRISEETDGWEFEGRRLDGGYRNGRGVEMRRVAGAFGLILCMATQAFGQEPLRTDGGNVLFAIVDKDGAAVFGSAEARTPSRVDGAELGAFFFVLEERGDRVRLCTVSRAGMVDEVGWMNRADLLEQRTWAWTVGEGIQQGLDVARYDLEGRLRRNEALPLRAIVQSGRRTVLQGRPGASTADDAPGTAMFVRPWYYVYDREVVDERTWVLLGAGSRVLGGNGFDHTEERGPGDVIRGWAPLDEMTIWATNLALELNTDPARVAQRVTNGDPATVYADAHREASPLWVEPVDELWGSTGQGRAELGGMGSTDPVGLGPNFPRLMVMHGLEDYLQVASFAASRPDMSISRVNQIRRKVSAVVQRLRQVDVVVVMDATGERMAEAMQETMDVLRRVRDSVGEFEINVPGVATSVFSAFSAAPEIRVSVIGFQDMNDARRVGYNLDPKVVLADLADDADDIEEAFSALIRDTRRPNRGPAALHDGLREAMKSRYWREDSVNRVVIVMGDEAGDTNDLQALIDDMPVFSEEALEVSPRARDMVESMSTLDHKRLRTKLYSVFLGSEAQWPTFRRNVELASTEMFQLFDFNNRANDRRLVDAVGEVFLEQQNAIDQNLRAFAALLEVRQESGNTLDTPGGLTELGIRHAMRRAGLSPEDVALLDSVTYYEGYVRESAVVFPENAGGQNAGAAHWRLRVLVSADDAYALGAILQEATAGLRMALDGDLGLQREPIAGIILRVVNHVTGIRRYSNDQAGEARLRQDARLLVEAVRAGGDIADADLASILALRDSLPIASDGLFGLTVGELLEQPEDWFRMQQRRLLNLAEGWRGIVSSLSVPEEPAEILSAPRVTKFWFTEIGWRRDSVAHVPLSYVP